MSILPTDVKKLEPPSSQAPSPNSSSSYGFVFPPKSPSPHFHLSTFESLQISESHSTSGSSQAPNAADTSTSHKKVRDCKELNEKGIFLQPNTANPSQSNVATVQGLRSVQYREKLSDPHVLVADSAPPNDRRSTHFPGRRGQAISGNHLLNFHYYPLSRPISKPSPAKHQKKRWKPYNKDLFLQANYKFVVLDSGQYTPENIGPDKELLWENIICVRFSTSHPVQCPICLDYPLCPQISSCGHIFCFPCILQYMLIDKEDLEDTFSKKCPLCFIEICPKDLYTVQIESVKKYGVGDSVDFLLLSRKKNSYVLSLAHEKQPSDFESGSNEAYTPFSNYIITSDVDQSVREGVSELESWLGKADSGLVDDIERLPYVCAALEELERRKECWKERNANLRTRCYGSNSEYDTHSPATDVYRSEGKLSLTKQQATKPDNCYGTDQNNNTNELVEAERSLPRGSSGSPGDLEDIGLYSFYQVADGQHLILHPLNMKCLLHYYGGHNMLPSRIRGNILHFETVTQSEAVRRRYRYLSHLSLTTTIQFCEIDLSSTLPPEALSPFMDEIKKREKQRKRVARKEEADRVRAEEARAHSMTLDLNFNPPYHEPPAFSLDDFEALGNSVVTSSSPPDGVQRPLFSSVTKLGFAAGSSQPTASGIRSSTSFADVIARERTSESVEGSNESGKKGKKPARVLMSTTAGRRY